MNHLSKKEIIASIFIIVAGCCWGMIGIFSRSLSDVNLNSIQISMLRALVTSVSLLILLFVTDRNKLRILKKDIGFFLISGVFSIVVFSVCYFVSMKENTLSLAAILLYTAPSFVVIMAYFVFKEKITKQKLVALIISFTGCFFAVGVFTEKIQTTTSGLIVGLGAGIGYALYSIFTRIALKKYNFLTVITYIFLFATIVLLPFSKPLEVYDIITTNPDVIVSTLGLGLLSTLLPFLLYTKGLEHLEVGKAAMLAFVEPVVATLVGTLAFHETLTIFNAGGILLIVLSLIILSVKFKAPYNKVVKLECQQEI